MGSGFFNIMSLLLGLIAWTLPIISISKGYNKRLKYKIIFSIISFSACGLSLCMQFFEINHRVKIGDLSALMDTSEVLAIIAIILVTITIMLNIICFTKFLNSEVKK